MVAVKKKKSHNKIYILSHKTQRLFFQLTIKNINMYIALLK